MAGEKRKDGVLDLIGLLFLPEEVGYSFLHIPHYLACVHMLLQPIQAQAARALLGYCNIGRTQTGDTITKCGYDICSLPVYAPNTTGRAQRQTRARSIDALNMCKQSVTKSRISATVGQSTALKVQGLVNSPHRVSPALISVGILSSRGIRIGRWYQTR
jgi:hypothetical protein